MGAFMSRLLHKASDGGVIVLIEPLGNVIEKLCCKYLAVSSIRRAFGKRLLPKSVSPQGVQIGSVDYPSGNDRTHATTGIANISWPPRNDMEVKMWNRLASIYTLIDTEIEGRNRLVNLLEIALNKPGQLE